MLLRLLLREKIMLEKSIVSLLTRIVSNVADLHSDLVLPVKAKKLWKTKHTFNMRVQPEFDMNSISDELILENDLKEVSKLPKEFIFEATTEFNQFSIAVNIDGEDATLQIMPIIDGVPIYEVEFGHAVEAEGKFATLKREPDLSEMVAEFKTLPVSYQEAMIHAVQKQSYAVRKKALKKAKAGEKKAKDFDKKAKKAKKKAEKKAKKKS